LSGTDLILNIFNIPTIAPYPYLPTRCSTEDNGTKPGNLQKAMLFPKSQSTGQKSTVTIFVFKGLTY